MLRKIFLLPSLFIGAFLCLPQIHQAQTTNQELLQEIQQLMEGHYISLEKAKETNAHLEQLMSEKFFDKYTEPEALAMAITEQMRKITNDTHLEIYPPRQQRVVTDPMATFRNRRSRNNRSMIDDITYFENDIGYFNLRYFGGRSNYPKIDVALDQLATADGLIIDLRQNGGGSASTVQYLCSYFFADSLLLGSMYARVNHQLNIKDHTRERWTVPINGQKRPDIPVYILTSSRTFSAAEDFAYTMQSFKKATIIGEITRGGAHPIDFFPLPNGFRFKIPFSKSINPVTLTNWEGVGVIPDVQVPVEEALEKAKILAGEAVSQRLNSFFEPLENKLVQIENEPTITANETTIFNLLEGLVQHKVMDEREINTLGYNYFLAKKNKVALAIFKSNTLLFPNSANAFDSYAENLATTNQKVLALQQYQKAVDLAKAQKDRNLAAFERNLINFQNTVKQDENYFQHIQNAVMAAATKDFSAAGQQYQKAFDILTENSWDIDRYNAACAWALNEEIEAAFQQLFLLADTKNYYDIDELLADEDLEGLHGDARWEKLIKKVTTNNQQLQANYNQELVSLLDSMHQTDLQSLRKSRALRKEYGMQSKESKAQDAIGHAIQASNIAKVADILAEYGYPGEEIIGEAGAYVLYSMIQHSNEQTRPKYVPIMKKAVQQGNCRAIYLTSIEDRIATYQGALQIYGNQVKYYPETKTFDVWPIQNPAAVDKRRAKIGLRPIAIRLKSRFNLDWDLEKQKIRTATFLKEKENKHD